MSAGFTKLFSSLVHSTVWREPDHVRLVWVTMLALADRVGHVQASIPGLADAARVTIDHCEDALERLAAPDPYSRTKEHEGRRIREIDGGWEILNYLRHRNGSREDGEGGTTHCDRSNYVYYVVIGERVKIGRSKNPWARVRHLAQAGHPVDRAAYELVLEAESLAPEEVFADEHIEGAWFRASNRLREHLTSSCRPLTTVVATVATTVVEPATVARRKKQRQKQSCTSSAVAYPPEFEQAWAAYPTRSGSNSKRAAFRAWTARVRSGVTAGELLEGVDRYRRYCDGAGLVGTQFVKQATTFFGADEHWRESWPVTDTGRRRADDATAGLSIADD